ncbi:MAG: NSS family neurotransmitter:Na+ symporter, partial [Halieaceae bacterium]
PFSFGNMIYGDLFGALFFLATFVAVLGSAVALMESLVSLLMQQGHLRRWRAALVVAGLAWLLSAAAVLSLGRTGQETDWFMQMDRLSAQLLIPLAVLLLTLFVGWRMPRPLLRQELAREPDILFGLWYFLIRFIAPPVVIALWLWAWLVP